MRKTKTQNGITLIALIITIIVLLILAVVAIGAVQDSDIIGHAQNAATEYNTAKGTEENRLGEYENLLDKYSNAKNVEYYIYGEWMNDADNQILKVDYNTNVMTSYFYQNGRYEAEENGIFEFTTNIVENDIEITLQNKTTQKIDAGGISFAAKVGEIEVENAAFYCVEKLYTIGLTDGYYYEYTLVTDANVVSEIEAGIANIE